jgi:hypothetical protein
MDADGHEVRLCNLPAGACVIQRHEKGPSGEERIVCIEPHSVLVDWQTVEVDKLPQDPSRGRCATARFSGHDKR